MNFLQINSAIFFVISEQETIQIIQRKNFSKVVVYSVNNEKLL